MLEKGHWKLASINLDGGNVVTYDSSRTTKSTEEVPPHHTLLTTILAPDMVECYHCYGIYNTQPVRAIKRTGVCLLKTLDCVFRGTDLTFQNVSTVSSYMKYASVKFTHNVDCSGFQMPNFKRNLVNKVSEKPDDNAGKEVGVRYGCMGGIGDKPKGAPERSKGVPVETPPLRRLRIVSFQLVPHPRNEINSNINPKMYLCIHGTQPGSAMTIFLATAKDYTDAKLETFAYLIGAEDVTGALIVTQLVFPEQGCSDVKVSGVRVVGIDRIANLGHYVTVTLPHCVWVAAVHPGRVFGK